jgi:hypothetical protein
MTDVVKMIKDINKQFPELDLQEFELETGEWIVRGGDRPLTKEEAFQVTVAYAMVRQMIIPAKGALS